MLIPQGLFKVLEYDAVFTVSPTSKFGHESDSVFATVEMLVENDQRETVQFPFIVLNTDPGTGAQNRKSVEPRVLNGVEMCHWMIPRSTKHNLRKQWFSGRKL